MDCYFLKIKIIEFNYNSNLENKEEIQELNNNEETINPKNINYEIEFELTKSFEKYTLKIINDNSNNKIPLTNYFTIPTSISIDKNDNDMFQIGNNYIDKDSLEISLYSNNEEKKLIDIDSDILIDDNCKSQPKFSEIYLGNFHLKFSFKLACFEDLYIRENDLNLMINNIENNSNNNIDNNITNKDNNITNNDDNINININNNNNEDNYSNINKDKKIDHEEEEEEDLVTKYHNLFSNQPIEDDIIYDESLFKEIEPIDFENNIEKRTPQKEGILKINLNEKENSPCGIYHDITKIDYFEINADIFEEEENEDEDEDIIEEYNEKEEISNLNENNYNIYNNTHLITYENITLEKP